MYLFKIKQIINYHNKIVQQLLEEQKEKYIIYLK